MDGSASSIEKDPRLVCSWVCRIV